MISTPVSVSVSPCLCCFFAPGLDGNTRHEADACFRGPSSPPLLLSLSFSFSSLYSSTNTAACKHCFGSPLGQLFMAISSRRESHPSLLKPRNHNIPLSLVSVFYNTSPPHTHTCRNFATIPIFNPPPQHISALRKQTPPRWPTPRPRQTPARPRGQQCQGRRFTGPLVMAAMMCRLHLQHRSGGRSRVPERWLSCWRGSLLPWSLFKKR